MSCLQRPMKATILKLSSTSSCIGFGTTTSSSRPLGLTAGSTRPLISQEGRDLELCGRKNTPFKRGDCHGLLARGARGRLMPFLLSFAICPWSWHLKLLGLVVGVLLLRGAPAFEEFLPSLCVRRALTVPRPFAEGSSSGPAGTMHVACAGTITLTECGIRPCFNTH